ncbi:hypothetical protein BCR44DRAFT_1442438, partial [Catenaria anguillulae PL171]
ILTKLNRTKKQPTFHLLSNRRRTISPRKALVTMIRRPQLRKSPNEQLSPRQCSMHLLKMLVHEFTATTVQATHKAHCRRDKLLRTLGQKRTANNVNSTVLLVGPNLCPQSRPSNGFQSQGQLPLIPAPELHTWRGHEPPMVGSGCGLGGASRSAATSLSSPRCIPSVRLQW